MNLEERSRRRINRYARSLDFLVTNLIIGITEPRRKRSVLATTKPEYQKNEGVRSFVGRLA